MVFCTRCACEVESEQNESGGFSFCTLCGQVLEEGAFAQDVQFAKGADGDGELVGQFVDAEGNANVARFANGRIYAGGVSNLNCIDMLL